ncbi:ATP-dependent Clp protease proteolytic subunit [Lactuca sativa]|uniref:ATP-dependent Clp protease proteolytic subunit n=1 Tax=Lactuca sativa TaxID=4236 RepID=UPI0022B05FCF|nr:ATP-dependent Clp protease proteolytic subunit [Lactuca sativa]
MELTVVGSTDSRGGGSSSGGGGGDYGGVGERNRVMIHQLAGSFSEVEMGEFILEVGELLKLRETLTRVYVQRTGKPLWVVSKDMEIDVLMSAPQAQAYGIIDLVAVE